MKIGLNPQVSITPITHDFSDYTFVSHVLRPTVLMVTGIVIAIFAGIVLSVVQDIVWGPMTSRRTHRLVVNEREFKLRPIYYLKRLARNIIESNRRLGLEINFLNDKGENVPSVGRALRRQFFTDLFEGLKTHFSTPENSDFLLYKTRTNELLIPQSEPMISEPVTSSIYYEIGAVMMFVFFNSENYLIGQVFHPSIFSAILSLTDEEIDLPFDQLTDAAKLEICHGLITAQINDGLNLRPLLAVLPFLQKKNEATDDEIADVTSFYGSAFEIADVGDITENKFLLLDERTKNTGQDFSFVLPDYQLNIQVIRENMDEFHRFCLNRLFNTHMDSLGILRLTLYPIHTMAKAMKRLAGDNWSHQIRFPSDLSDPASSSSTPHSVVEVGNRLNRKIQGELNRQVLISKVTVHSTSSVVQRQWEWMQEWILDENNPISKIEGLLIFWSGSPSIDWDKQRSIHIEAKSTEGPYPYPGAGGCSFRLKLPNRHYEKEGISNVTKEGFFEILNQISTERGWSVT